MAEPRGRDGKAVEVKCVGGVSPPAGGVRGASPGFFLKKWCHLVHSEIFLGAFLNALKHHVYGAGKSFFTAPMPHYALVICNHAPHPRGIAGTLTFVLQIPAKSPALWGHPVGKTTALFPPQSVMFSLHCHVCLYKTNPWHLPRTAGTIKK